MSRNNRRSRAGYVLVMFGMLTFAIFGLAALVIDLGMVRLTQRQMQTAVDGAALEGLLLRDQNANVAAGSSTNQFDQARRQAATQLVANVFDDNLDPTTTGTGNFGAGPVVELQDIGRGGSDPTLAASRLLVVPPAGQRTYLPLLQTNTANAQQGDMVAGQYGVNANYQADGCSENATYTRQDFTPSSTPTGTENAFLVRLRRTNDLQGLDNEQDISSSGPAVPFLFARGSTIHKDASTDYSPREQGLTVRATAIASVDQVNGTQLGQVKSVGAPVPPEGTSTGLPGATPFDFYQTAWIALVANSGTSAKVTINGDGTVTLTTTQGTVAAGFVTAATGQAAGSSLGQLILNPVTAGGTLDLAAFTTAMTTALPTGATTTNLAYVPIIDSTPSTTAGGATASYPVLGFVAVTLTSTGTSGQFTIAAKVIPPANMVGQNASPAILPGSAGLTADLLAKHQSLASNLVAPVLVSTNLPPNFTQNTTP